jgi:hypothetical protein
MHTQCRYELVMLDDTLACYTVLDFLAGERANRAEV